MLHATELFHDVNEECLSAVIEMVTSKVYLPGEFVVVQSERSNSMFFVIRGSFEKFSISSAEMDLGGSGDSGGGGGGGTAGAAAAAQSSGSGGDVRIRHVRI